MTPPKEVTNIATRETVAKLLRHLGDEISKLGFQWAMDVVDGLDILAKAVVERPRIKTYFLPSDDLFAAGVEAAAEWIEDQRKNYPEDIFVPPQKCKGIREHEFIPHQGKVICKHCKAVPQLQTQYSAHAMRYVCDNWPKRMKAEIVRKKDSL